MKILYIEDDVYRNQPIVRYFKDVKNWAVILASSPKEALTQLEEESDIDLILLDIMMAADNSIDESKSEMGMSTGILLLDKIHKITKGSIPIVILTARQDLKYLKEDERVSDVLEKPVSAEEIIVVAESVVLKSKDI